MAWVRLDDVKSHFGVSIWPLIKIFEKRNAFSFQFSGVPAESDPSQYSYLCPDGKWQLEFCVNQSKKY